MKIIINKKFLTDIGAVGIALYSFIILKNKEILNDKIVLNHEKIHILQQKELETI